MLENLNFAMFMLPSDEPLTGDEIPYKPQTYWVGVLPPVEAHVACTCYADVQETCRKLPRKTDDTEE